MQIAGKRVLITGAGRGLGRTLVFAFAEAGAAEVIAGTRTSIAREQLMHDAEGLTARITPVQLDVTSDPDVHEVGTLGLVDILVNNAGVAGFGNPVNMSFADIQREVDVNYLGTLRVTRAIVPGMVQKRDGIIVNVATAFAKISLPLIGTYCATKAALLSLGQALRAYLSEHNVRVITVMPTTIDTDMSRGANVPKMTKEFVASQILETIRDEAYDPPIGDEAKGVFEGLLTDPREMERMLAQYRA